MLKSVGGAWDDGVVSPTPVIPPIPAELLPRDGRFG
ncbi:MAG: hypothetical protein JWO63_1711, partial [Frankiales bacterium]|nr:hypothetical protein [Frankiales bacterium]